MTPEPQAENRGAGGRDGDLEALRKQAFNQAARHGSCTAANDLVRLAKEARDERDEWKHLEGVEPTALRIRAEAAEKEIAALRAERDSLNDQWSDAARLASASEASAECLTLRAERDLLQRQLDAVDAHLPEWETEPGSTVGCVGRVQTILNLKADRVELNDVKARYVAGAVKVAAWEQKYDIASSDLWTVEAENAALRARVEDLEGVLTLSREDALLVTGTLVALSWKYERPLTEPEETLRARIAAWLESA